MMNKKQALFFDIFEKQIVRILNKWNSLEKKPRNYGNGDLLFPSEIHTIVAVAKNPDVHMTEIAKCLGVTRGAIMQTVIKLEKKELITRFMKSNSNKKVFLQLTEKGQTAFLGHERFSQNMMNDLFAQLNGLKQSQLKLIQNVLDTVEDHVNGYLKEKELHMESDDGTDSE